MKRILALLFALVMLLALTACGKDEEGTPTGESTGTTDGTQDGTQGTTEDTTEGTEESTTSTEGTQSTESWVEEDKDGDGMIDNPRPIDPSHQHSYVAELTNVLPCGTHYTRFKCSCGDFYNEDVLGTIKHTWGEWYIWTQAFVDQVGQEVRFCSACQTPDTKESMKNAGSNSFCDYILECFFEYGEQKPIGEELIHIDGVHSYVRREYSAWEYEKEMFEIPANEYLIEAKKHFVVSDAQLNPNNDAVISFPSEPYIQVTHKYTGYIHKGGKIYTVYYAEAYGSEYKNIFAVELEYNGHDGTKPCVYLSIKRVDSLPSNIIE